MKTQTSFSAGFALQCTEVLGREIQSADDYEARWLEECRAHGETKRASTKRKARR